MNSIIKQICNVDLCLSERGAACVAEFRVTRDIAVQAHDAFEDKLCQSMKQELDEYLSKESDVSAYHTEQAFVDGFKIGAQMMLEILEVARVVELEYVEVDGLLYPNIDTGFERLSALDKYGKGKLAYLHAQKPDMYRELLFAGKLAEHCERIEAEAFKLSEKIQESYIAKNPLPEEDFWMRVSIRVMAQMVANEVVQFWVIEG